MQHMRATVTGTVEVYKSTREWLRSV